MHMISDRFGYLVYKYGVFPYIIATNISSKATSTPVFNFQARKMKAVLIWKILFLLMWDLLCYAQTPNYCQVDTCSTPTDNTLCLYTGTTWGSACQTPYKCPSKVSAADITTILTVHNDLRRLVASGGETRGIPGPQPPASNMRELIWDNELALMAKTHAQQCVFKHDACRDVSRFQVGQNIYIAMSTAQSPAANWTSAIMSWYNEVQYVNSTYVSSFKSNPTNVIGHYTQVVWADSYLVGCGLAYYNSTFEYSSFRYKRLYVCNYGPSGNWLNEPVYKQGTAGTECPSGTSPRNGLCANV